MPNHLARLSSRCRKNGWQQSRPYHYAKPPLTLSIRFQPITVVLAKQLQYPTRRQITDALDFLGIAHLTETARHRGPLIAIPAPGGKFTYERTYEVYFCVKSGR
jgi:hypothetical protein